MLELLKQMGLMAHKFEDFILKTKDKEDQDILKKRYVQLIVLMEKLARQRFDENDGFYQETIEKVRATGRLIKKFYEKQLKLINVFAHIVDISDNVMMIIQGGNYANGVA